MRVRLTERQLSLIKEDNKKISPYEKIKSHKIFPHLLSQIKDMEGEDSVYMYSTHHYSGIISNLEENYGIPFPLASFTLMYYLIQEGVDPHEIMSLDNYLYRVNDVMGYLKSSGYYDEYIKNRVSFRDITRTEDGRILFTVDGWVDFVPLFSEKNAAEQILSEDWLEWYDNYDYPMSDIVSNLSDENVRYVINHIIEEYNGESIGGLDDVEEFVDLLNEDGDLIIDERLRVITDQYDLGILLSESDLLNEPVSQDLSSAYNNAYNNAAESELWENAKNEIEDYLESEGKWGGEKGDRLIFDVTNRFDTLVEEYIETVQQNPLDEYFSFIDMLEDWFRSYLLSSDLLSLGNLDYFYPSSDTVIQIFNENIGAYL